MKTFSNEITRREFLISTGLICGGLMLAGTSLSSACSSNSTPEMKLHIIKSGTLFCQKKYIVYKNSEDMTQVYGDEVTFEMPVYGVLIQHPEGNILFDAGCHFEERQLEGYKQAFAPDNGDPQAFITNLSKVDSPDNIDHIILSHLHTDHTGFIDRFPNAQIYIGQKAFTELFEKDSIKENSQYAADVRVWMQSGLKWNMITDEIYTETKFLDGISIIPFGDGHSYGMIALLVELSETGNIILCSDVSHTAENFGPPSIYPIDSLCIDKTGYVDSHSFLRELAKKKNAQIWFSHDSEQFATMKMAGEGYYI